MKVPKLMTSEYFGFFIESLSWDDAKNIEFDGKPAIPIINTLEFKGIKYKARKRYDSFVSKTLKLEQFLNTLTEPHEVKEGHANYGRYMDNFAEWRKRENALLFKPDKLQHGYDAGNHTIDFYFGEFIVSLYDDDSFKVRVPGISAKIPITTLEDLAYFTNSEIVLINTRL